MAAVLICHCEAQPHPFDVAQGPEALEGSGRFGPWQSQLKPLNQRQNLRSPRRKPSLWFDKLTTSRLPALRRAKPYRRAPRDDNRRNSNFV